MSLHFRTIKEGGADDEACGSPNSPFLNSSSALQVMCGKTHMSFVYNAFVGS